MALNSGGTVMVVDEVRQKWGRLTQVHWPVGHEQELPQLQVHPGPKGRREEPCQFCLGR